MGQKIAIIPLHARYSIECAYTEHGQQRVDKLCRAGVRNGEKRHLTVITRTVVTWCVKLQVEEPARNGVPDFEQHTPTPTPPVWGHPQVLLTQAGVGTSYQAEDDGHCH